MSWGDGKNLTDPGLPVGYRVNLGTRPPVVKKLIHRIEPTRDWIMSGLTPFIYLQD
jgi:hypothetical protein